MENDVHQKIFWQFMILWQAKRRKKEIDPLSIYQDEEFYSSPSRYKNAGKPRTNIHNIDVKYSQVFWIFSQFRWFIMLPQVANFDELFEVVAKNIELFIQNPAAEVRQKA